MGIAKVRWLLPRAVLLAMFERDGRFKLGLALISFPRQFKYVVRCHFFDVVAESVGGGEAAIGRIEAIQSSSFMLESGAPG